MRKSPSHTNTAKQHISSLFLQAETQFKAHPELSRRYIVLARKIAMKYNVRLMRDQKMMFCKKCSTYLKKGVNSTLRVHDGRMILTCNECGHVRRWIFKK